MSVQSALQRQPSNADAAPDERAWPALVMPLAADAIPVKNYDQAQLANIRRAEPGQSRAGWIEPNWRLMSPAFGVAMILLGLLTKSIPGFLPGAMGGLAMLITASAPWAGQFGERHAGHGSQRFALNIVVVGVPMLLFGLATARWVLSIGGAWQSAVGLLTICGAIASIILNRRVSAMVIAVVGMWLGVAIVIGSIGASFLLTVGAICGLYMSNRQLRADTEQERLQQDRERRQLRAEEILIDYEQTGKGWFWETDHRGMLVYVSHTVAQVLGTEAENLFGKSIQSLFKSDPLGEDNEQLLTSHLTTRSAFGELALRAGSPEEERWWSLSGRPIYDSLGNFMGFRGSGSDLTEKRRSEQHASRLAHYDSLTGLANRLKMSQTLEKLLHAPNPEHRNCTVFLLDLDRFKQVNDTMGHPVGDALLTKVASRLERAVGQIGRVGRVGGDEFQVVLAGRHGQDELARLARQIIQSLSEPYSIEGHRLMIGASIGIAVSPDDGVTSEAIIRNADLALYAAKDSGRGRHYFYAADLHSDAEERRQLEQDLRDALIQGGLELHYQPVIHTSTERITGFEALLRWKHPTRGPMSPAKFIPIAEDSGLIAQIGEWVLRTACRDLAGWPENVRVAVNVSPLQFANPALPAIITSALAAAQIHPSRLELEITESVFLNEGEGTDAMFAALKRVGVRLALDDFGTGYSSLGYLKKAPFDKIKIDQSFVRGATITGSRNGAIIASIVNLAEALGMETTAEGVETLDELDLVRMLGCSHVQGYIYAKPMTLIDATRHLREGTTAIANGPRATRAVRHTMLRKVVLDHGGQLYHGTIRNISSTGALVEGLWNVPPGTIFRIILAEGHVATATARWCQEDRIGMEFASPLDIDEMGRVAASSQPQPHLRDRARQLRCTASASGPAL